MKSYPVAVEVHYTSGRTERLSIKADWPVKRLTLEDAVRHGAVRVFSFRQPLDVAATTIGKEQLA